MSCLGPRKQDQCINKGIYLAAHYWHITISVLIHLHWCLKTGLCVNKGIRPDTSVHQVYLGLLTGTVGDIKQQKTLQSSLALVLQWRQTAFTALAATNNERKTAERRWKSIPHYQTQSLPIPIASHSLNFIREILSNRVQWYVLLEHLNSTKQMSGLKKNFIWLCSYYSSLQISVCIF